MYKHAILSPHFDDAVIDCWHLLGNAGSVVVNVFAGVPPKGTHTFWDRVCGEADSFKMVHKRIAENKKAIAMSGNKNSQVDLIYLDNQYRSKKHPSPEEIADDIESKLPKTTKFYAPLALSRVSRHADHVLTRNAAIELHKRGYKVGFFPDYPYMNLPKIPRQSSLDKLRVRAENEIGLKLKIQVVPINEDERAMHWRALKAYGTQYKMTNLESFGGLKRAAQRTYEVLFIVA